MATLGCAVIFGSLIAYPFPDRRFLIQDLQIPYGMLGLLILAFAVMARLVSGASLRISKASLLPLGFLATGLSIATLVTSLDRREVLWSETLEFGIFISLLFLLPVVLTSPAQIEVAFRVMFWSFVFLCAYGLYRYFSGYTPWVELHQGMGTRSGDALYFLGAYGAAVGLVVHRFRIRSYLGLTLASLAMSVATVSVVMSLTRGAWMAALAVPLALAVKSKQHQHRLRPMVALGIVVLTLLLIVEMNAPTDQQAQLTTRLASIFDSSVSGGSNTERANLYWYSLTQLPDWGLFGTGVGRFSDSLAETNMLLKHGHNILLTVWIETGLLGAAGVGALFINAYSAVSKSSTTEVGLGLQGVLIAWGVYSLFETPSHSFFFWAVLGLCLAVGLVRQQEEGTRPNWGVSRSIAHL